MRFRGLSLAAFAALSALTLTPASAAPTTYAVDAVHSYILFRVKHMDVGYAYGRFNAFSGSVTLDEAAPQSCAVKMEIDVASVDTGDKGRDDHLRNADFFNAAQFPKMTFESTAVKKNGDEYEVTGNLSLHGVTKPAVAKMTKTGMGKDRKGNALIGFEGTLDIKRSDFGVGKQGPGLADDVRLTISIEASAR
jgi:polyisoprenoid-binding protein YceI